MAKAAWNGTPHANAHARPVLILGLFLALALGAGVYGSGVQSKLKVGGLVDPTSESSVAREWLHDSLGVSQPDLIAIFSSASLVATDSEYYDEIEPVLSALAKDPAVESTTSYFDTGQIAMLSSDESRAAVFISLRGDDTAKRAALERLKPLLHTRFLRVELGGPLPAELYAQTTAFRDLEHAELIVLPLVAVLLFLFFHGVTAMLLPIAVAVFAVPMALACLRLLAGWMNVSVFALNVASFIGIGLAIDYSLLMVTRYREEVALGRSAREALDRTQATAGRSILISGGTVVVSLAALLIFPLMILRSIGIAGIFVVASAMLGALFLLPALLAVFGDRIHRRRPTDRDRFGRAMHAFARTVMRKPILVTVLILALLFALAVPAFRMKSVMPDVNVFPPESQVRQVDELLESRSGFGKQPLTPILVAVRATEHYSNRDQAGDLIDFMKRLKELPGVDRVESPVGQGPLAKPTQAAAAIAHPDDLPSEAKRSLARMVHGDLALIYVYAKSPWRSSAAADLVASIRELPTGPLDVRVGGSTAENLDGRLALVDHLPMAIALIVAANVVILFLAFGSVVLPFKAIAMNIASLAPSLGALVWIFQEGHLSHLLSFDPPGGIDMTVPVVLIAIVFGLSMDYEIFLLSRIKEEFDRTGDNTASVANGLEQTSSIISRAAVLLITVVAAFALGELIFIKEIGVGMVIAILIDASIVRCILVPSTMRLLGDLNWWSPKWLRRIWHPAGWHA